jgi:hypothetical protein
MAVAALKVDVGWVLVVSGDAEVDDGVQDVEGFSGVWSGESSRSCRGGEGRLEVFRCRCTLGGDGMLILP